MKKAIALILACLLLLSAALAQAATPDEERLLVEEEPFVEEAQGRLSGLIIGIDPGHQAHANKEQERVAPDSKETKKKCSSGTSGVKTRVDEYVVNLDIGLQLRDALTALGATVVMTRETHDIDISNIERAQLMNEAGADVVLRLHCDGSENHDKHGINLYVTKSYASAAESKAIADVLLPAMCEATGAKQNSVHVNNNYTMNNWSEVPCILVEMGYMSNAKEDVLLNTPEYQQKLIEGMINGLCEYFGR